MPDLASIGYFSIQVCLSHLVPQPADTEQRGEVPLRDKINWIPFQLSVRVLRYEVFNDEL